MVLLVALIAIGLASDPNAKVLGMVSYAWAGFGAAFGPVIILAVFWQGMTRNGALAGIIVGAVTVLVWKQFGWLGLYEIVPGFILCGLTVFVVSRLGPTLRPPCWPRTQRWKKNLPPSAKPKTPLLAATTPRGLRPGAFLFARGLGMGANLGRTRDRWQYRLRLSLNPTSRGRMRGIPFVVQTNDNGTAPVTSSKLRPCPSV